MGSNSVSVMWKFTTNGSMLNRRQNVHFDDKRRKMSNRELIVKDRGTLLKVLQKGNNAKTPITGIKRATSHTVFQIVKIMFSTTYTR